MILPSILKDNGICLENHIFRFRSDNYNEQDYGNSLKEILNNQIWHSTIGNLNDPFEVYFKRDENELNGLSRQDLALLLKNSKILQEHDKYIITSFLNNDFEELHGDLAYAVESALPALRAKFRERVAVACFTQLCTGRLMWGYYCNGFKGLCIIYNKNRLTDSDISLSEVSYSSTMPLVKPTEWMIKQRRNLPLDGITDFAKTKHSDWKTENEHRSLFFLDDNDLNNSPYGYLHKLDGNCIDGIILGNDYSPAGLDHIKKHAEDNHIKLFKASANLEEYNINFESLCLTTG
ncbi:TPA: DUF2971 domain-containing protein [Yersinia enterocolitica]